MASSPSEALDVTRSGEGTGTGEGTHTGEVTGTGEVTHTGGCHCGRVRFEVIAPAELAVSDCNCSICTKSGYLHLIVSADRFRLISGGDSLTHYTFNTGTAKHYFCLHCGVKSFYIPRSHPDGYSVNARCIDSGTVKAMTVTPFDGRDWERGRAEYGAPSRIE